MLSILSTSLIFPAYCQTPADIYCRKPKTFWRGQLWVVDTTQLVNPLNKSFNGRLVNESSIKTTITYDYPPGTTNPNELVTPLVILRTKNAIYLYFNYMELCPYGSTDINVKVTGELVTGKTFESQGPGPGFMRRP